MTIFEVNNPISNNKKKKKTNTLSFYIYSFILDENILCANDVIKVASASINNNN